MEIPRSSGVLLHITSLPGRFGIGTLGPEAYFFADLLKKAGVSYWQILPIGPVAEVFDFCPYASTSTFAGNTLFISLELLADEPWCAMDIPGIASVNPHFVDFKAVMEHKLPLLEQAYGLFAAAPDDEHKAFRKFCTEHAYWLDDYTLFSALAQDTGSMNWPTWETSLRMKEPAVLDSHKKKLAGIIEYKKFLQYIFFKQWTRLKEYCNKQGISLIGDIPIYITMDGADSWSHRDMLQLDPETGEPHSVSGVPPDYFSATGQRWGNPLYDWFDSRGSLKDATFNWWKHRISHLHRFIDIIRIDHFRGFEAYWSIPADEETAVNGEWVKGPDIEFFMRLRKEVGDLPLIAEDLGVITPEVEEMRESLKLPGMKILQFAFDFNNKNTYLPHNYDDPNFIIYTGTHDNNTTNGWFYGNEIDDNTREYILEYLGVDNFHEFHWKLIRQAYRSTASLIIIPAQDILGYGAEYRMNTPGTTSGNWRWMLTENAITDEMVEKLRRLGLLYNRLPNETKKNHLD